MRQFARGGNPAQQERLYRAELEKRRHGRWGIEYRFKPEWLRQLDVDVQVHVDEDWKPYGWFPTKEKRAKYLQRLRKSIHGEVREYREVSRDG